MIVALIISCHVHPESSLPAEATLELPARATGLGEPQVLIKGDNLVLDVLPWSAGGDQGRLWRVTVPLTASMHIAPSDHVVPFADFLPAAGGTWAAINGGFYEGDHPMGLVLTGGVERNALQPGGGSGVFGFGPTGLHIVHRDAWVHGDTEALQSIDRLVDGGVNLVNARLEAPRAARSAVALNADTLCIVAAASDASISDEDGGVRLHATSGRGPTLGEFADLVLAACKADTALNLDGAVSTQLAVQVSDARFEVRGERGTINAVVVATDAGAVTPP